MVNFIRPFIATLLALSLSGTILHADDLPIADDAALRAALDAGAAGRTLVLAPGVYAPFVISGDTAPDGIRSADPANPAVVLGLVAVNFDGLRIENLVLDYRFNPADPIHVQPFRFENCENFVFAGNRVIGDFARGRGPEDDGFGWGIGVMIGNCSDIIVQANHISRFHRGLNLGRPTNAVVRGNELTALRMDGMNFSTARNVLIEGNHIHSFHRSLQTEDHADMIQFWTTGAKAATRDITIRGNVLNSGDGLFTQSIFMRNELVDRGRAGREMFYQNVLIEDNVIINAHLHGITVGETISLTVRNNTVAQNLASISSWPKPDNTVWRPTIRIATDAVGVRVEDNLVWRVIGFEGQAGWRVSNNLRIQNRSRMEPAHYTQIFQGYPGGDPGALESYYYRPDGQAGPNGLGSSLLRQ